MKSIALPADRDLLLFELDLFDESVAEVTTGLNGYHRILDGLLQSAELQDLDRLKERLADAPEFHYSTILDQSYPYWWQDHFVPQFRASFVVWAISVAELHLAWAARIAEALCHTAVSVDDIRARSTVKRYEKFFSKLARFDPPAEGLWERLADAYTVRNTLAHAGAYIPFEAAQRREALERALETFGSASLDEVVVKLETGFCEAMTELTQSVCSYLQQELRRAADHWFPDG